MTHDESDAIALKAKKRAAARDELLVEIERQRTRGATALYYETVARAEQAELQLLAAQKALVWMYKNHVAFKSSPPAAVDEQLAIACSVVEPIDVTKPNVKVADQTISLLEEIQDYMCHNDYEFGTESAKLYAQIEAELKRIYEK